MVDVETKLCGIIGTPISHTLSPKMYNAVFNYLGLNFTYLAFNVEKKDLHKAIDGIRALNFQGANITMPFKESAVQFLDRLDLLVKKIGAVNTVVNEKGKLVGYNTDAYGAIQALKCASVCVKKEKVIIIGAGGAAKAVAFGLVTEGAELILANRTIDNAQRLSKQLEHLTEVGVVGLNDIEKVVDQTSVLINCTPLGYLPNEAPITLKLIREGMVVFDLVYSPSETKLLRTARELGAKIIPGTEMLIHQGAKAFELWTGRNAPLDIMRDAIASEIGVIK